MKQITRQHAHLQAALAAVIALVGATRAIAGTPGRQQPRPAPKVAAHCVIDSDRARPASSHTVRDRRSALFLGIGPDGVTAPARGDPLVLAASGVAAGGVAWRRAITTQLTRTAPTPSRGYQLTLSGMLQVPANNPELPVQFHVEARLQW